MGGSSPRVWGTLQMRLFAIMAKRFIPTRVGNTLARLLPQIAAAVHPHACGEHQVWICPTMSDAGSSPRVWGTQAAQASATMKARFIPTRVGNTLCSLSPPIHKAVHPHACGEHTYTGPTKTSKAGSSPRVWGTLGNLLSSLIGGRFIPTRVGNT